MGWAIKREDATYRAWFEAGKPILTLLEGEAWEERAASPAVTNLPVADANGFEVALHDIFPGQDFFTFWAAFPYSGLFLDAIRRSTWPLAQALVGIALQTQAITQNQYNAIRDAAATYHIPMTL